MRRSRLPVAGKPDAYASRTRIRRRCHPIRRPSGICADHDDRIANSLSVRYGCAEGLALSHVQSTARAFSLLSVRTDPPSLSLMRWPVSKEFAWLRSRRSSLRRLPPSTKTLPLHVNFKGKGRERLDLEYTNRSDPVSERNWRLIRDKETQRMFAAEAAREEKAPPRCATIAYRHQSR